MLGSRCINRIWISGVGSQIRARHISTLNAPTGQIVLKTKSRGGRMIVCWHPEQKFPYEHSKPMPREQTTDNDEHQKLRSVTFTDPSGPSTDELNEMFHVTKHIWRHQPRLNRAKKDTPVERNAL